MIDVSGWFKKEIYYNETSDYLVGKVQILKVNGDLKEIKAYLDDGMLTIVGVLPRLKKDYLYRFFGVIEKSSYGMQLRVDSYETEEKQDGESLVEYLSGDLFKGVGKKTARKIVSVLGTEAIDKIIENKNVLDSVPVSSILKDKIYDVLINNYESEKIIRFLLKNGFGYRLAKAIYKKYLGKTISYLEENPYRLIDDIENIGFKRADALAYSLKFDMTSPFRIQAALKFIFEEYCYSEGFTYLTMTQLFTQSKRFLNEFSLHLEEDNVSNNIEVLIKEKKIVKSSDRYFLPELYEAEVAVTAKIRALSENKTETDVKKIKTIVEQVQKESNIIYTDRQREAIETALVSRVTIVTGGPGTGKTTVVKGILKACQLLNGTSEETIALAAPTGRAAKRLSETTGLGASTIHRLLGFTKTGVFGFDENNRLNHKIIICDESSMIDILLASRLLKALKNDVQLILVGDVNQLPSVGPGNVLKDLIESEMIPTVMLDVIHRQKSGSSIITLAYDINQEVITADLLEKQNDRNFIRCTNDVMLERLEFIVSNAMSKDYGIDNIQVLAPMYKGVVGIDNINSRLQAGLNPKSPEKKEYNHFNKIFRTGDKVIQLVNRPQDNIMNGDIGYITAIYDENDDSDDDAVLVVSYDDNEVKYEEADLNDLSLAYCISIHKSQGSEFDIVILVLSQSYSIMLRKKLLYTAVTRAKKALIMLGDPQAYKIAVKNSRETIRQTTLKERLTEQMQKNVIKIDDYEFKILPKAKLTPYDFL